MVNRDARVILLDDCSRIGVGCTIRDTVRALGIDVRIGLHTGEIELRGEDIGGLAVHIAQRVSAHAQPAEVLVSRTVVDLVAGSSIEFADRGFHTLKGVPDEWRLFAVAGLSHLRADPRGCTDVEFQ